MGNCNSPHVLVLETIPGVGIIVAFAHEKAGNMTQWARAIITNIICTIAIYNGIKTKA